MAREDLHFRLRIPEELKKAVEEAADANRRSMTAEIVSRLEQSFRAPLVLPEPLLERIRIYAERQGRTANEEILQLLEREFPEQWPIDRRLQDLAASLSVLAAGKSDPRVQNFLADFEETVTGIITGRVTGVDAETRDSIEELWKEYREREAEAEADAYEEPDYNEEERRALEIVGRPEKYAEPPPRKPDSWRNYVYLSDILPKYELAELTTRLSEADVEGAKRVLDNLQKDKLLKQIELANMSLWERMEREAKRRSNDDPLFDDPFEDDKK